MCVWNIPGLTSARSLSDWMSRTVLVSMNSCEWDAYVRGGGPTHIESMRSLTKLRGNWVPSSNGRQALSTTVRLTLASRWGEKPRCTAARNAAKSPF